MQPERSSGRSDWMLRVGDPKDLPYFHPRTLRMRPAASRWTPINLLGLRRSVGCDTIRETIFMIIVH